MFGRKNTAQKSKLQYDQDLLDSIDEAKSDWLRAQETQNAISEVDDEIIAQTQLARCRYLYLYREARFRKVHNNRIQSSVFDY
ncbi:YaaL family protein [Nicoliella spurrieriana]|uniref:YaaL family protein n=1 Tax=Nicoliella spurrieriana TaxID=2925830 RepID=A0A976X5Q6_9LACO|nr:YaaL family protein [Nicoliella spurrieriana]UQS87001.1 YaaL family protein [Nicoliella spurrieriana]